ncbi:ABC transporter related [Bacillus sp. ZZV12-4809]|nr:ABC transporter related [Bacillus sp. ZZV12-4809]
MAVIVSSHLLSEMEMMCDRIGIIQNGKLIDVQHISDFVQGKEKVYEVEVDAPDKAQRLLKNIYPELPIQVTESKVFLPLVRDSIPEMIKEFVREDIKIFAVREVTKTLEDRFLEVTEYKGGAEHARIDSK